MTVSCFFDESGKFKDHKVVSIGGVAAYAEQVAEFSREWGHLLWANGLKEFTAKQAFNARRPLSEKNTDTGIDRRIEAVLPFVGCIRKYLQVIVAASFDVHVFKKLPQHYFAFFGNDQVYTAFARCILQVLEFTPDDDRVSLIFDEDEETVVPFYRLYKQVKKKWPEAKQKLAAISFADDDDKVLFGLQASDLVASLIRLEMTRKWKRAKYDYSPLFKALTAPPQKHERLWFVGNALGNKENLMNVAEGLRDEWKKHQKRGKAT
ncbi:MAG: DUF3800 domain-containing protein [Candidatus Sulfotelmatobacter sp.]